MHKAFFEWRFGWTEFKAQLDLLDVRPHATYLLCPRAAALCCSPTNQPPSSQGCENVSIIDFSDACACQDELKAKLTEMVFGHKDAGVAHKSPPVSRTGTPPSEKEKVMMLVLVLLLVLLLVLTLSLSALQRSRPPPPATTRGAARSSACRRRTTHRIPAVHSFP